MKAFSKANYISRDGYRGDLSPVHGMLPPGIALPSQGRPGHIVYNFTVAKTHTYIADGVRVHNTSAFDYIPEEQWKNTHILEMTDDGRPSKTITVLGTTDGIERSVVMDFRDENGQMPLEHGEARIQIISLHGNKVVAKAVLEAVEDGSGDAADGRYKFKLTEYSIPGYSAAATTAGSQLFNILYKGDNVLVGAYGSAAAGAIMENVFEAMFSDVLVGEELIASLFARTANKANLKNVLESDVVKGALVEAYWGDLLKIFLLLVQFLL
ncbi:MAG: hypothetical protein MRY63_07085 [Neomegalonema sp.]|nr:hypothetical protein [Neomegalonema sp.]